MPDSSHFMYMMKFTGCELLNLVNVLGQMYFMDRWVVNNFFYMYIGIFNSISINIFVDRKKIVKHLFSDSWAASSQHMGSK